MNRHPLDSRSIIKDTGLYGGTTYLQQFVQFFVGIITKGILGPTFVGLWSMLNVLLIYMGISQLGTMDAGGRHVPYFYAKGNQEIAENYKNTMATFSTIMGLFVSLGLVAYILIEITSLQSEYKYGLLLIAILFPIWQFNNAQINAYRYAKRFVVLSKVLLIGTFLNATVGLYFIWKLNIYGQYLSFATILFIQLFFYWKLAEENIVKIRLKIDWDLLKTLLKDGLPLQISGLNGIVLSTAHLIVISRCLDLKSVGFYSLALGIQGYIYQTPNSFSIIMFPRFQEKYALSNNNPKSLLPYIEKPTMGLAFFYLPIAVGWSFFLIAFIIRRYLTEFLPTLDFLLIFLAGTFFLCLNYMPAQFLITIGKLWQRVILDCVSSGMLILFSIIAGIVFKDLTYIAGGVAFACVLGSLIYFHYCLSQIVGIHENLSVLKKILISFAYTMFGIILINEILYIPQNSLLIHDATYTGLSILAYTLWVTPLFIYGRRFVDVFIYIRTIFQK
jgi:O-antigen/teichoic acid export membrane protein